MPSFKDHRNKKTQQGFVGRQAELNLFQSQIATESPDYLIFLAHGNGGVGKTTLLNQWIAHAKSLGWWVAQVDEGQNSVEAVMQQCRDELVKQGAKFPHFDKSYQQFRRLRSEAEKALVDWQGQQEDDIARSAGMLTGKSLGLIAEAFGPSKAALELVGGKDALAKGFGEGFAYLKRRASNKEDLAYLDNPLQQLTQALVQDLNASAEKTRLLLCFDTYEYLAPFCDNWFCKYLLQEDLSDQMRLAFAGRDPFAPAWLEFQNLCAELPLEPFSEKEARSYLAQQGLHDDELVEAILHISGRLPLYLALLSTPHQAQQQYDQAQEHALHAPNATVVERFLQWIPHSEADKRKAVTHCAILRKFNRDSLQAMLEEQVDAKQCQTLFSWLITQTFVRQSGEHWRYYQEVREPLLRHQKMTSPAEYKALHQQALRYFQALNSEHTAAEQFYHGLMVDKQAAVEFAVAEEWAHWVEKKSTADWREVVEDICRYVDTEKNGEQTCLKLWQKTRELSFGKSKQSEKLLQRMGESAQFRTSAWAGGYNHFGSLLENLERFNEAEAAYRKAIEIDPEYSTAHTNLAKLLEKQKRFEALTELFYDQMQFSEAKEAINKSIELEPDNLDRMIGASEIHFELGEWQKSIDECYRGIHLDIPANEAAVLRFLQWIPHSEADKGKTVTHCAILRKFNRDSLQAMLGEQVEAEQCQTLFSWLITQPFIRQSGEHWRYHQEVRKPLLRNKKMTSPAEYKTLHQRALRYFEALNSEDTAAEQFYHGLVVDKQAAVEFAVAEDCARWVEKKSTADWREVAQDICRYVDKETNGEQTCLKLWQKTHNLSFGKSEQSEKLVLRISESTHFRTSARVGAYTRLGILLKNQKRFDEGEAAYRKAIDIAPENAWPYNSLGNLLRDQKKFDKAEAAYCKAIELDPGFSLPQHNLGSLFIDQKNFDKAEAAYRKAIELAPENAWHRNNLGVLFQDHKKFDQAEAAYRKAIELDPKYAAPHNNLGSLFQGQKKFDKAQVAYRKAIEITPKYARSHANLGSLFQDQKKFDEAEAAYRKAIEIAPENPWHLTSLGSLFKGQRKFDKAEAAYRKAIELDPEYASGHNNLGVLFEDQKKFDKAEAAYRKAIEIAPEYATAHTNIAELLRKQKRFNEAEIAIHKTIDLTPEQASLYEALAELFYDQMRLSEAEEAIKKALELEPDKLDSIIVAAEIYFELGEWQTAIDTCYRGIHLDMPADEAAVLRLLLSFAYTQNGEKLAAEKAYPLALANLDIEELNYLKDYKEAVERLPNHKAPPLLLALFQQALQDKQALLTPHKLNTET